MLVGVVIFFLGLGQYHLLYTLIPETVYHAAVIWILNFLVGTLWTHAIHRHFTFKGSRRIAYFLSLLRTYIGYAGIHLLGSVMMLLLVDMGALNHLIGWCITTLVISTLNFVVMRHFSIVSWERSR
jgi:hypothetical protein